MFCVKKKLPTREEILSSSDLGFCSPISAIATLTRHAALAMFSLVPIHRGAVDRKARPQKQACGPASCVGKCTRWARYKGFWGLLFFSKDQRVTSRSSLTWIPDFSSTVLMESASSKRI
jgi:hypothetical protein